MDPLVIDAASPPGRTGRPHLRLVLLVSRLAAGWLLAAGAAAMAVSTVETWEPVVECGGPALFLLVDGSAGGGPPERVGDCEESAAEQVFGGLGLFGVPAVLLLAGPRTRRRWREVQHRETVASRQTGVWRMSVVARRLGVLGIAFVVVVLAFVLLLGGATAFLATAAFGLPFAAYLHRMLVHPRLVVGGAGLEVVNPFRTSFVASTDVHRVAPASWGLDIGLHDGRSTSAMVGQKADWATWRGRRRHADDVADAVACVAAGVQGRPCSGLTVGEDDQRSAAGSGLLVGGVLVVALTAIRVALGW